MSKMQNSRIDFMLLRSDVTQQEIELLCSTAHANQYGTVCVPPTFAQAARSYLADTDVQICTVISFPMGYVSNKVKLLEITEAIESGVHEVEVVPNLGNIRAGNWQAIEAEFSSYRKITDLENITLTIIYEIDLWDILKISDLSKIAAATGIDFVKTSTDTRILSITPEKVESVVSLMKPVGVKACGKIQQKAEAIACWEAGAARICTSFPL